MATTPEHIREKEESLSALMQKVLHKPLQPLSDSIEKIRDELAFSKEDIIKKIGDASGASINASEEFEKSIRNIQSKVKELKSAIEQYHSAQTQAQIEVTQNINAYVLDHTKHLQSTSDALLAACHTNSQQHTQLANTLQTWIEDLQQAHATSIERQTVQAQTALQAMTMRHEAAQQATEQMRAALAEQIAVSDASMAERMTTIQAMLLTELSSSQQTLARMQTIQTNSHTALMHALDEQRTALSQQLTQAHSKLQRLTAVVGGFFACTLIYVGYDIWHQLR